MDAAVAALLGSAVTGVLGIAGVIITSTSATKKLKLEYEQQEHSRLKATLSQERNAFYVELIKTINKCRPIIWDTSETDEDIPEIESYYYQELNTICLKADVYCDKATRIAVGKIIPLIRNLVATHLPDALDPIDTLPVGEDLLIALDERYYELCEALRKSIGNTD